MNLYSTAARPIQLDHHRSSYEVSVQGDREVFSVVRVSAVVSGEKESIRLLPLYALRKGKRDGGQHFWFTRREPRDWSDESPSDLFMSFVDLDGRTMQPGHHSVMVDVLCSDGHLPHEAMRAGSTLTVEEDGTPSEMLLTPTRAVQPPIDRIDHRTLSRRRGAPGPEDTGFRRSAGGGKQHWRLVSMLSLNHLSLVEEGLDAFQELLSLHDPGSSSARSRHIDGIVHLTSEPTQAPVRTESTLSFARGRAVDIRFDEEQFAGAGVYLFASVIERFLGMYASVNSFSRLTATTVQRNEPLRRWAPRAGTKPLL